MLLINNVWSHTFYKKCVEVDCFATFIEIALQPFLILLVIAGPRSIDSWSATTSLVAIQEDALSVSRGPSPGPLTPDEPIPIAVSFTEIVNAYYGGANGER